jgi:hypothetical protein
MCAITRKRGKRMKSGRREPPVNAGIIVSLFQDEPREKQVRALLRRLPPLTGDPIRLAKISGLRDRHGAVHGGAFLRERRIAFDCGCAEFPRIFVHELFHFVWLRAGNPVRRAYEEVLAAEMRGRARGELGWSAEWRKEAVRPVDLTLRARVWREYCCESFCDTAAWLYSGIARHEEFTLAMRFRLRRRTWFGATIERGRLSI